MIGSVDKLMIYKDRIYILDKLGVSGLLIFSETGEFLFKTSLGKGPGELIFPQTFNIIDDQLIISDLNLIKYYTLDGKYLRTKTLSDNIMGIWSFELIKNNRLFIHGITKFTIKDGIPYTQPYHVIDKDFSECNDSFLEIPDDLNTFKAENPICSYDGRLLVTERPSNYIYQYDGMVLSKKYFVDFGNFSFKKEDISKGSMHMISLLESGRRFGLLDNIHENKSFISFIYGGSFDNKAIVIPVIYSKKTHECANFHEVLKNSDLPKLTLFQLRVDDLVCIFNPGVFDEAELIDLKTRGLIPEETTLDSNPIVTIVEVVSSNKRIKE